ncbi:MAG: hypothetical protein FWG35_07425 [Spirochaetaceae bacterium]|nr:hypothetical protein [Spirochaetaceae bacterium]
MNLLRRVVRALAAAAVITVFSSCPYNEPLRGEMQLAAELVFAHSWEELCDLIDGTPAGGSVIISVQGTLEVNGSTQNIKNKEITLISFSSTGKIIRGSGIYAFFDIDEGGVLILGHEHSRGTLVLDGEGSSILIEITPSHSGACVMNKGVILRNSPTAAVDIYADGLGVFGSFTMNGGTITEGGTGVIVAGSLGGTTLFTMNGGTITKNKRGVSVENKDSGSAAAFIMNGGTIKDNTADTGTIGCGVSVLAATGAAAVFTMNSGTISGNTADYGGGVGVVVSSGATAVFAMKGGTIKDNTAEFNGGGVCVHSDGEFVKTGGTIYGSNGGVNSNKAGSSTGSGHAAYVFDGPKSRDTSAGPGVKLDSGTTDNWGQ